MTFNLSATFVMEVHKDKCDKIIEHSDYVFCNETEAEAWGKVHGMEGKPLKEVVETIAKFSKINKNRPRFAVVTQGKAPVMVATYDHSTVQYDEFPISPVPKEKIVDSNGCGDSFVGAFLASLAAKKSIGACVKNGIAMSGQILQQIGCQMPDNGF